ncbi:MAG: hypothetical protein SF182_09515 [Deltaproteobacteria bacterium]|nr:hypothetical protein [Deltaproteobacteria bacterium]
MTLHLDIPTLTELRALTQVRADACVSLYLPTTPLTQQIDAARIELGNLSKAALGQLTAAGFDKRRLAGLDEQLADLADDDEFWTVQAHSLAVLATPDQLRTFRLPNRLQPMAEVSDRFHVKPLLRAVTFPHEAFVLALTENGVRLIEVCADLPATEIAVAGMPSSAADLARRASVNTRSASGRIQGSEGQKVLLRQFARRVDEAVRAALVGHDAPLILAATEPLASIYRSLNTHPGLLESGLRESPVRLSAADLAQAARPLLDASYAAELERLRALYAQRGEQGRTTADVAVAARAATRGAIEVLMVDIDAVVPGLVDEESGAITLAAAGSASTYGVIDEIARRALLSGARVLGVRAVDIPGGTPLAATLRYADAGR